MAPPIILPASLPPISGIERDAILDSILRATLGLDHKDQTLFDSALVDDMTLDLDGSVIQGRTAVHGAVFDLTTRVDITHFVTNQRILLRHDGKTALVTASAQAYHYRKGTGLEPDAACLINGTSFALEVVETETGLWKIKYWSITRMWSEGTSSVLTG